MTKENLTKDCTGRYVKVFPGVAAGYYCETHKITYPFHYSQCPFCFKKGLNHE